MGFIERTFPSFPPPPFSAPSIPKTPYPTLPNPTQHTSTSQIRNAIALPTYARTASHNAPLKKAAVRTGSDRIRKRVRSDWTISENVVFRMEGGSEMGKNPHLGFVVIEFGRKRAGGKGVMGKGRSGAGRGYGERGKGALRGVFF